MLHFHTLSNAAEAIAYFRGPDYHFEGAEQKAYTLGKGAELLGLPHLADPEHFRALIENHHPFTGEKLTSAKREDRDFARDMTVSIVKSATLAATVGQDERIESAVERSLARMFAVMEKDAACRVRKGGKDHDRNTGNLVAFVFPHQTTRPIKGQPDPQLHWHVVMMNLTFDSTEHEWKAVQFRPLLKDSGYYNAVFRADLANELQGLGYEIRATKDAFELAAVPERAIKEFSRRTSLIEKTAEALGITRPETKAKLGATTREKKSAGKTWGDLMTGWESRLTPTELAQIREAASATKPHPLVIDNREALDWSLRHLLERKSVVPQRELLTTALRHGIGHVTLDGLHDELGKRKDLIRRDLGGQSLVSTQGVLSEEKRIVAFAVKGRGLYRPLASGQSRTTDLATPPAFGQAANQFRDVTKMVSHADSSRSGINQPVEGQNGPNLTAREHSAPILSVTQEAAVRHALSSRDRLILIRGAAGTGKTTMTKALLEQVNVPWVILAPSAEASRGVLRREGFSEAETLAKFLIDTPTQEKARNGLIVLDEASLAGAHDMARLIQVADSLNSRVLLLGDRRQHKSVARGDVLTLLEDRAGLPVAEVSEIRRQGGEYREAVKLASQGRVSDAFSKLDKLGWVKQGGDEQIAEDYTTAIRDGKSVLVVSPTHAEGDQVTAAIREKLKAEGKLKGEERTFESLVPLHLTGAEKGGGGRDQDAEVAVFHRTAKGFKAGERVRLRPGESVLPEAVAEAWSAYRADSLRLAAGDSLRITANGKDLTGTHRLNNGATYTVTGFTDTGNIKLNNGWTISKDFGHLAPGYAVTSHASQGKTVDVVLIAMGNQSLPAMGSEQFYVSTSRARHKAQIYCDDKEAVRDAIQREDKRFLASDLVRAPKKGVRDNLKRRVSFLRDLGSRLMDHARGHGLQKGRNAVHERD
jgi:conjugative relaxase-like TrwC/TraI family protein